MPMRISRSRGGLRMIKSTVEIMVILFCALIGYLCLETSCEKTWEASGMRSSYTLLGGCKVEVKDGIWLPGTAYREVD